MEALACVALFAIGFYGHTVFKDQNMENRIARISNALFELGIDMKHLPTHHAKLVRQIALNRVLHNPMGANVFQAALECFFAVTVKSQRPEMAVYKSTDREALSRAMVVIATWGKQRKIRLPVAQSALLSLSAHLFDTEQTTPTADSFVKAHRILQSTHFMNFKRLNS